MDSNELTKVTYSEDDKKLLKETLFKGVPEFRYRQGWHIVETYGIDLFIPGQFFVTPRKDRKTGLISYQFTVGHPVLLRLAHQLGMKTLHHNLEYEPEDVRKEHPISDTVTITRDDGAEFSKPTYFRDYYSSGGMWDSKPHVMLEKCAEDATIRIAFRLYGLYTREEMGEAIEDTPEENEFDLDKPFLTPELMKTARDTLEKNMPGQKITDEEAARCKRKDGNYDEAAVTQLFNRKKEVFNAAKKVSS